MREIRGSRGADSGVRGGVETAVLTVPRGCFAGQSLGTVAHCPKRLSHCPIAGVSCFGDLGYGWDSRWDSGTVTSVGRLSTLSHGIYYRGTVGQSDVGTVSGTVERLPGGAS